MIYCVSFDEVREYVLSIGFREIARFEETVNFERGAELLTTRRPNVNGHVPESLVNDAFDAASLAPPPWDVFWCD